MSASALITRVRQMGASPYNGLLDTSTEGLEAGMRGVHESFMHCNQNKGFVGSMHEQFLFSPTYLTMHMPDRQQLNARRRIKAATLMNSYFPADERREFDQALEDCGPIWSFVSFV